MISSRRAVKRLTILGVCFAVIALVGAIRYFDSRPAATCFDGMKNQNEQDVDCGGSCAKACEIVYHPEDLIVREAVFVPGGRTGIYDVLARVYNPNDELGAAELGYVFRLKDAGGTVVAESSGTGFILPQETKTFLSVNLVTASVPASVEIVFTRSLWEKFSGYQEKPPLSIFNKRYTRVSSGPFFFEAGGTLVNDSSFDFRSITVKVILRDAKGDPIAFNQTEMNTIRSRENRDFRLTWPTAFPGEVATMDVEPEADVYHSDNFIERYLPSGRFQELR